jgi:DNA-binding transcriptional ArsR family regulator
VVRTTGRIAVMGRLIRRVICGGSHSACAIRRARTKPTCHPSLGALETMRASRAANLDAAFTALSDSTRRAVIGALLQEPRRAGELAATVGMSPPALSRHLRVLRKAGLIVEESIDGDARVRLYRVEPAALAPVRDWLAQVEQLWGEQLQAFKLHAERTRRTRGSRS